MKPGKDYIGVGCGAFILNDNNEYSRWKIRMDGNI